jgi:hypothetical protein
MTSGLLNFPTSQAKIRQGVQYNVVMCRYELWHEYTYLGSYTEDDSGNFTLTFEEPVYTLHKFKTDQEALEYNAKLQEKANGSN